MDRGEGKQRMGGLVADKFVDRGQGKQSIGGIGGVTLWTEERLQMESSQPV